MNSPTKRLTRLQVDGLKNLRDVDLSIPPMLAIAGPNGAGKTALLQAIRLAVMGYEPELGKTLAATRQLASNGDPIEVALHFDTGFTVRRTIGGSMEIEVTPPEDETTLAEKGARIERELGTFVPSFDLEAFLGLSAEKRREYLFGLLPRDLADLKEDAFRAWLGYEKADAPLAKAIDKLWIDHVLAESSPIDGLASAIDFAHTRWLEADRKRQDQEKVVRSADADAAAASTEVEYDPDRLDELQAELDIVTRRLGEYTEQEKEAERAAQRAREREHQQRVVAMQLEEVREKATQVAAEIEGLEKPDSEDIKALEAQISGLREGQAERMERYGDLFERRGGLRSTLESLAKRLAELDGADACPVCGMDANLDEARAHLEDERAGTGRQLSDVEEEIEEVQAEMKGVGEAIRQHEEELKRLRQHADHVETLTARQRELTREEENLRQEERRLEELEVESVEPPDPEVERELTKRSAHLRQRVREERDNAKAAGKAEGERERADRERETLKKITARATALKDLHGALQALRAHVIQSMVAPIEETANELLQAIDPEKRFRFLFEREGKSDFDFGFEEEGAFRSYDAASTGEDAFLAVVLVAALIAACRPEWPVLLVDNVESVDDGRRADLMRGLGRLSERIGNVILAGCCDVPEVDGWETIAAGDLTRQREAVAA